MRSPLKVFAGAGELSGDQILSSLLQGLRGHFPDMEVCGFGGPFSESQGLKSFLPIDRLAVNGIGDVLRRSLLLVPAYFRLKKKLGDFKPDLVLLVDYPGMNIRLARHAKRLGFSVHYVAPPQLWAYRNPSRRLHRLRRMLAGVSLQVLFPFEAEMYASWAVRLSQGHFFSMPLESSATGNRLLLCPGSRRNVLRRNLPLWLNRLSATGWKNGVDVLVPEFLAAEARVLAAPWPDVEVFTHSVQVFSRTVAAISFPGTMTLELFLHRIPTQIWAVLDPLTLQVGRKKLRSRFTALPNLLSGMEIFPEWVGTVRDFKRQPPVFHPQSAVRNEDVLEIQRKIGSAEGVAIGVRACLELLL